jgi:hypothetical protein
MSTTGYQKFSDLKTWTSSVQLSSSSSISSPSSPIHANVDDWLLKPKWLADVDVICSVFIIIVDVITCSSFIVTIITWSSPVHATLDDWLSKTGTHLKTWTSSVQLSLSLSMSSHVYLSSSLSMSSPDRHQVMPLSTTGYQKLEHTWRHRRHLFNFHHHRQHHHSRHQFTPMSTTGYQKRKDNWRHERHSRFRFLVYQRTMCGHSWATGVILSSVDNGV